MDVSMNTAISGIQASILRHNVTANDVANVNTPGYAERTPIQSDLRPAGTQVSAIRQTPNPDPTMSNTDLAEESKEQIVNKNTLAANVGVLKAKDRMIGELLDLVG